MLRELFYKWFNLELPPPCETCEVLRNQLDASERERKYLLEKLLNPEFQKDENRVQTKTDELRPIRTSQYTPWRVKQQMLEQEDRRKAELMKRVEKEMKPTQSQSVEELEKELGVENAG